MDTLSDWTVKTLPMRGEFFLLLHMIGDERRGSMFSTLARKTFLFISIFILTSLACDMSVSVAPTNPAPPPTDSLAPTTAAPTSLPATQAANPTATAIQTSFEGVEVTADLLKLVLPPTIASGAHGTQVPRADGEDLPVWGKTPGHLEVSLEGYALQGKFHEPKIYVYPALEYAQMVPAAFESIHRLDNILYPPGGPKLNDQLPAVPFFNAQQVFASNIQLISFQNGQGVRFLTEYAQFPASANNQDLFYHFEGVTRDGTYYIVAILPINNPMLAATSDAGAPLPTGGVPYPFMADPNADMQLYYKSVIEVLNATPSQAFTPTIEQLDQLIQSIQIGQ